MKQDALAVGESAGIGVAVLDRPRWRAQWEFKVFRGDEAYDPFATPINIIRGEGNLVTGAGVQTLWNGLTTSGLAVPFSTTNAQIAVGDGSTAAKPSDTDLGAAAGSTVNTGDISAATNASPIVLTVPGWTVQPIVGQVVVVAGVLGNTAANGTFEVSAVTSTTLTLLNSSGNGAFSTSAGSTVKVINKYRQACSAVNVNPAVGSGVTGATNANPIVITTSAAHNLTSGQIVKIASVGGNTAANTTCYAKVLTSTTFSLYNDAAFSSGVAGNGAYTSGGTVNLIGGVQFVGTFGTANGNFAFNEWGISTGGAVTNLQAAPPPTLLNHAVTTLLTKTSAVSVTATMTLSIA